MVITKLGLEAGPWMAPPHQGGRELLYASLHMLDRLWRDTALFSQRQRRVYKAVVRLAAGVGLESVLRQLPAGAEIFGRFSNVVAGSHHADQAALAFEDAIGASEAALCKQSRHGAVLGGFTGMERLAHGAEHFA